MKRKQKQPHPISPAPQAFADELATIQAEVDAQFAETLGALDAKEQAYRAQRATIVAGLAEAEHRRDAAKAVRAKVARAAVGTGNAEAEQQRREALAAYGAAVADLEDYALALGALDDDMQQLAGERTVQRATQGRALLDAIGRQKILPLLADADAILPRLRGIFERVEQWKQAQETIAGRTGLLRTEKAKRFRFSDYVAHCLRWQLGERFGLSEMRHPYAQGQTLCQIESKRQGFVPDDDADDTGDAASTAA